jgi:hypothetical protein
VSGEVVREEWELTGQPHGAIGGKPFPPYRFVFGNPNEMAANKEDGTTSEQRARSFMALADVDQWTDVRLRSRVIVESPWREEQI